MSEKIKIKLALFMFMALLFVPVFKTLGMQSDNFRIDEDSINFGGTEESESENYKISDTLGEIGTGEMEEGCYSLDFNGASDYVDIASNDMISQTEGTISLWFRVDEINKDHTLIISGEDNADAENSEDKVFIAVRSSDNKIDSGWQTTSEPDKAVSNNAIAVDRWYHTVLTWSLASNAVKLYVDGSVQSTGDVFTNDNKNTWSSLLVLGRAMPTATNINFLNGLIDDVRIYNRALTADEISDLYWGEQINDSGLTLHWNLNEGSGVVAYDYSSLGNDGTISGADFSEDTPSSTCQILNAGYRQLNENYISISSPSDVVMSPAIAGTTGGTGNGSAVWTVITDNPAGYQLDIKSSTSPALQSGSYSFADYTESVVGTPDYNWSVLSSDSEFGYTVEGDYVVSKFLDTGVVCGVGSSNSIDRCWYGFSTTDETIVNSFLPNHPVGKATTVKFRAQSGASHVQEEGNYTATITATALSL